MYVLHKNICCPCLTKASFVIFVNISDHGRNYDELSVPGTVETVPLAGWTGTSGATFYNYLVLNYLSPYTTLCCDSLNCLCLTPAPVVCEMSKSCYSINALLLLWSRQCFCVFIKKIRLYQLSTHRVLNFEKRGDYHHRKTMTKCIMQNVVAKNRNTAVT